MKIIINESQFILIKEDYEEELKKYQETIAYRNKIGRKLTEIFNIQNELYFIFNPTSSRNPSNGFEVMDYYINLWKNDKTNKYFKCGVAPSTKNEINPSNFSKSEWVRGFSNNEKITKLSPEETKKAISLYNQTINKIKELNSIKPPKGITPVGCINAGARDYLEDEKTKEKHIKFSIGFVYPLIPVPKKPKKPIVPVMEPVKNVINPITQKQKDIITTPNVNTNQVSGIKIGSSDESVFGPGNSLIGFMRGRDFIPATGQYAVGMNKADKDLLNNKEELNKYIQRKWGEYANKIN